MKLFSHQNSRAFTLVEMIVSLAIFSIVAVVALAALVKIVSANKKAQTIQSVISNLNFSIESMSREMRTGQAYHCNNTGTYNYQGDSITASPCTLGLNSTLAFRSSKTTYINPVVHSQGSCSLASAYRFKDNGISGYSLQKAQQSSCTVGIADADFVDITDPSVVITNWRTKVTDVTSSPYQKAVIFIEGYAGIKEKEKTYFAIQTAVSSRVSQ